MPITRLQQLDISLLTLPFVPINTLKNSTILEAFYNQKNTAETVFSQFSIIYLVIWTS